MGLLPIDRCEKAPPGALVASQPVKTVIGAGRQRGHRIYPHPATHMGATRGVLRKVCEQVHPPASVSAAPSSPSSGRMRLPTTPIAAPSAWLGEELQADEGSWRRRG